MEKLSAWRVVFKVIIAVASALLNSLGLGQDDDKQ